MRPMEPQRLDGTGHRILVVDDDLAIRVLLQAVLTRLHFEVDLAPDGAAALDLLKNGSYDLILLDLMMPRIDGFEFLDRTRGLVARPHIIVFTAAGQRGIAKIPAGAVCSSILKPFDLEAFIGLVGRCLENGAAHPTGTSGE